MYDKAPRCLCTIAASPPKHPRQRTTGNVHTLSRNLCTIRPPNLQCGRPSAAHTKRGDPPLCGHCTIGGLIVHRLWLKVYTLPVVLWFGSFGREATLVHRQRPRTNLHITFVGDPQRADCHSLQRLTQGPTQTGGPKPLCTKLANKLRGTRLQ